LAEDVVVAQNIDVPTLAKDVLTFPEVERCGHTRFVTSLQYNLAVYTSVTKIVYDCLDVDNIGRKLTGWVYDVDLIGSDRADQYHHNED
jgi:hypothetical protein